MDYIHDYLDITSTLYYAPCAFIGILYAVDGSEVDIADDIIDLLSAKNFPSMSGKPKLVILQACAGSMPADSYSGFMREHSPIGPFSEYLCVEDD